MSHFGFFQFAVLTAVVMIMSVPYNAVIIAHEKMGAFAYISVLEVIFETYYRICTCCVPL